MHATLLELDQYAAELEMSFPEQGSPVDWMTTLVDFCDQCVREGRIRDELEPLIPLRTRGAFARAIANLKAIGGQFSVSRKVEFDANISLVRRALQDSLKRTSATSRWLEEDPTTVDALLPLSSRKALDTDIPQAVAEATEGGPLSLLMIDLDHFKSVNDTHGHPVGDEVLKSVASVVKSICALRGKGYRYGGEELAVLLPNSSPEESLAVGQRIRQAVAQLTFSVRDLKVTASIGVTTAHSSLVPIDVFLKQADDALYQAKQNGRDQVRASGASVTADVQKAASRKAGNADEQQESRWIAPATIAREIEYEESRRRLLSSEKGVYDYKA
jgi:diguanylate cyclase (GGDEF)-like protein